MTEEWRVTPEEAVLDFLYCAAEADWCAYTLNLYGVTEDRPEPVLYVEDGDGTCWEVTVKRHDHG